MKYTPHARAVRPLLVKLVIGIVTFSILAASTVALVRQMYEDRQQLITTQAQTLESKNQLSSELDTTSQKLIAATAEIEALKAEDQRVRNNTLEEEIKNIQTTFQQAVKAYEDTMDLRGDGAKTQTLEADFGKTLALLSKRNYASASATMQKMTKEIASLRASLATSGAIPANVTTSNTPPGSGYVRQAVESDAGKFLVDMLAADLNSSKVVVETASAGDCKDNCPVAALGDFVARAGGFAGINGPYFCPASYPSCAGKTNSFDTLLMNKSGTYFNVDNNVYSTVPAMIFAGNSARLVSSGQAGRDGGATAVIAGQPALVWNNEVSFGGDGDPKKGSRGPRSFIANKGSTVYIGVVRSATVAEAARVMKALGMNNALNLDSGGSTAFLVNGKYIAGPGRATPFGIVLVRK